jgi:uncharacterized protein with FMN-binding domain
MIIALSIVGGLLGLVIAFGLIALAVDIPAQNQIREEELKSVDFTTVPDGTYRGSYDVRWRHGEVNVTVESGRVADIDVIQPPQSTDLNERLVAAVIDAQSLEIDTISGASITTKLFLLSVQDAVVDAPSPATR